MVFQTSPPLDNKIHYLKIKIKNSNNNMKIVLLILYYNSRRRTFFCQKKVLQQGPYAKE